MLVIMEVTATFENTSMFDANLRGDLKGLSQMKTELDTPVMLWGLAKRIANLIKLDALNRRKSTIGEVMTFNTTGELNEFTSTPVVNVNKEEFEAMYPPCVPIPYRDRVDLTIDDSDVGFLELIESRGIKEVSDE